MDMTRKIFLIIACAFVIFSANAQEQKYFEVDDIRYRILSEADGSATYGTASVAEPEFGSYEGDVVIPNVVKESKDEYADSYKIIGIDDEAFFRAEYLRSVKLPPSIEIMGVSVFSDSSIESISIPVGNLTKIGKRAFKYCNKLKEISIPSTIKELGAESFDGCRELYKVNLNEGLEKIDNYAFSKCIKLESIVIPNTVRYINAFAFSEDVRLASITIGEGVKSIGSSCFENCVRLRNVKLPDDLREIGSAAFNGAGIVEIVIPNKIREIKPACFRSSKIRQIVLPSGLRRVGVFAFAYCKMDGSNNVPEEIWEQHGIYTPFFGTEFNTDQKQKERESVVKQNKSKLKTLTVDYHNVDIGTDAYKLGKIWYYPIVYPLGNEKYGLMEPANFNEGENIPDIIEIINGPYEEKYIVKKKTKTAEEQLRQIIKDVKENALESIELPEGLIEIPDLAFAFCNSLQSVRIPSSVEKIGYKAFFSSGLTSVDIPNSVRSIGDNAFRHCTKLSALNIPTSVTKIGKHAFENTRIKSVEIPNNVDTLLENTFSGCKELVAIKLPKTMRYIGDGCFQKCENLSHIELPESLAYIGDKAFYFCKITELIIPKNVKYVGSYALVTPKKTYIWEDPSKWSTEVFGTGFSEFTVFVVDEKSLNCESLAKYKTHLTLINKK